MPFTIAVASMSHGAPSLARMMSIGAPPVFSLAPRMSKPMPITRSPFAACTQGAEPECVYTAMFWCSLSMNSQAAFSPMIWIHA